MTGYALYHGGRLKADSTSLKWLRNEAMKFHGSKWCDDFFVLPHPA